MSPFYWEPVEHVLSEMPMFTEPVTLEDITEYAGILRVRIAATGMKAPPVEVYRTRDTDPVTVRIGVQPSCMVRELVPHR